MQRNSFNIKSQVLRSIKVDNDENGYSTFVANYVQLVKLTYQLYYCGELLK
jgi:hypothetical protein